MTKIPSRQIGSIPTDIIEELSPTSDAAQCFSGQKFSRQLQQFLVDYSLSVSVMPLVISDSPQYISPKNTQPANSGDNTFGNNIA